MPSADEKVQCPHCEKLFRRRDLRTIHTILQKCRECGETIQIQESFIWRDDAAIFQEDVNLIESWLDEVCKLNDLTFSQLEEKRHGEITWSVEGIKSGQSKQSIIQFFRALFRKKSPISQPTQIGSCQVVYQQAQSGVIYVANSVRHIRKQVTGRKKEA